MIQRVQSLFFLFSSIFLISIVYFFPVLEDSTNSYLLKENFTYARFFVIFSAALSFFAIFQFKNRKRQRLIGYFSRLMITIALCLIVFLYRDDKVFSSGMLFLIVPFISLIAANFFIKRDDKLIKSVDRIR